MRSFKTVLVAGLVTAAAAGKTCKVKDYSEVEKAVADCKKIAFGDLEVPANKTLDLTNLKTGAKVYFNGKVTFAYSEWNGPLVRFGGSEVVIDGRKGLLDGDGKRWWDTQGGNGGKVKPKFIHVQDMTNGMVKNLNIKNAPRHCFTISGHGNTFKRIRLDNSDGNELLDGKTLGHNTDAFGIGLTGNGLDKNASDITIRDSWVSNQDDCLAVNSGVGVKFLKNTCIGGHGVSIGSIGLRPNNTVDDVLIQGNTIVRNDNSLRIKTKSQAPEGSVNNVRFLSNTISGDSKYCITIRQDYTNLKAFTGVIGKNVSIDNITINGLKQTNGTCTEKIIDIKCGNCSNFNFKNVQLTGGQSTCEGIKPAGC